MHFFLPDFRGNTTPSAKHCRLWKTRYEAVLWGELRSPWGKSFLLQINGCCIVNLEVLGNAKCHLKTTDRVCRCSWASCTRKNEEHPPHCWWADRIVLCGLICFQAANEKSNHFFALCKVRADRDFETAFAKQGGKCGLCKLCRLLCSQLFLAMRCCSGRVLDCVWIQVQLFMQVNGRWEAAPYMGQSGGCDTLTFGIPF